MQEQIQKITNPFFLGKKWKTYLKKVNISQKENRSPVLQERKEVILLNQTLKSKLSIFFLSLELKTKEFI